MKTVATAAVNPKVTLSPEVRAVIVKHLGAALAAAWRNRQSTINDKRPEPVTEVAGRDVHDGRGREHEAERTTPTG